MTTTTAKLSKTQRHVVERLEEGWQMGWSKTLGSVWLQRNGVGRGGETEKVSQATARVLLKGGVIECVKESFPTSTYGLTSVSDKAATL